MTHTTHHDDCGCLRKSIAEMLRDERDRMEALALQFKSEGNERMSHLMRIRANTFEMSAYMVEMMP
jgi:hypothetical protein